MPDSSNAERTPDGHYLIIDGRRWRASDPGIPDTLRQELVDELMSARRAVRTQGAAARSQIGRAHVRTPVTNAHLVRRLLLEQKLSSLTTSLTIHFTTYRHSTQH